MGLAVARRAEVVATGKLGEPLLFEHAASASAPANAAICLVVTDDARRLAVTVRLLLLAKPV